MNLNELTITKAREGLINKEFSRDELWSACHSAIAEHDDEIHAFLSVCAEDDNIDEGPLAGIPVALKDNILVRGLPATAGSKILENYHASYDATVVERLKEAGARIIGKTNLDEFAMGSSTENSAFGPTKNPHDTTRVAGGSSGGSVAAVAADMCLGALGSETGGSVRQPASFCGVVGLKPTYGSVSRHGLIALASSLDQIGPVTKSVEDAEILFSVIAGHDPHDATTLRNETREPDERELREFVLGVPREYFELKGLDPAVRESVEQAIAWFEGEGARVTEVSLPHTSVGLSTYYVIVPAEASSNLARYDGIRYGALTEDTDIWEQYRKTRGEGLGPEPTRRVLIGTYVLSAGYYDAYYKKALAAQAYIRADFETAFETVDALLTPTSPTVAFKLGERAADPLHMYAADIFTVPMNIAGLPALSVPCGKHEGLPIGLQIIAPWRREDLLFKLGALYETR
jgi:aspartyl-tRNA(Asn)/glutamyl-tRNA(Gln) amidotransferase subunit A